MVKIEEFGGQICFEGRFDKDLNIVWLSISSEKCNVDARLYNGYWQICPQDESQRDYYSKVLAS